MSGVKFRVPGSAMLQQYYRMVGANPTPVAWGETPSAIKQGVADALDPSVGALFVFGFKDILSHVTFTQAVPDSQVYSINLEWFNSLPADVQEGIEFAGEVTQHQNLSKVPSARSYAMSQDCERRGIPRCPMISLPNGKMLAATRTATGIRSRWTWLAMDTFTSLEEAAGTRADSTSTTPKHHSGRRLVSADPPSPRTVSIAPACSAVAERRCILPHARNS
jgi:TRAP-type C4-dicarboxylate transport system substrate-binding protein